MRRTQRDYGLPELTFDEAARVLGVAKGELMAWVMEHVTPGESRWSKWVNQREPLPEAVIRLYLMWRGGLASVPGPLPKAPPAPLASRRRSG